MPQILRNRNLATKFQILVEIAAKQPYVPQKDIAAKVGITSQAVSEHIRQLAKEGLLASHGRSKYTVTKEGVDWALKALRELQGYAAFVKEAVTNITVCAAVADCDLSQGQVVGLKMKDGLLYAASALGGGARGIAVAAAQKGADVGVSNIEGIVELRKGEISVIKVPGIHRGGSRAVDIARLKKELEKNGPVGSIGIEALVALRQAGFEPPYVYGVTEAAVEAAHCGLPFLVVCTEEDLPGLLRRLETEGLDYEVQDLRAGTSPS